MSRHVTTMTIYDVDHYTDAERSAIIAGYPPHERDARAKGVPMLGSGRVYPISEDEIKIDPIEIPNHWYRINGMDFGIAHPFAAVSLAYDKDFDVIYVTHEYRKSDATPPIHVSAIKPWGDWIPCAWPHDGLQRDKGTKKPLASHYRDEGLYTLPDPASHADGGNSVETGVYEIFTRMETGRFKVFNHLHMFLEEFRLYHRKDGFIVKEHDDIMDACRYAVMSIRLAKQRPARNVARKRPNIGTHA